MNTQGSNHESSPSPAALNRARMRSRGPRAWRYDPVIAAYRRILSRSGIPELTRLTKAAALIRWRPPQSATSPEMTEPSSPGDGVVMLIRRHLPIRVELVGEQANIPRLTVISYTQEGGLRRSLSQPEGVFETDNLRGVKECARRGFIALKKDLVLRTAGGAGLGLGTLGGEIAVPVGQLPDEMWLARELGEASGGLVALPFELLAQAARATTPEGGVVVDGVTVTPGTWVYVRLETRMGLQSTETAMLIGAERMASSPESPGATRLVLRNADGMITTCWTRGPGWVRRIVPMNEAEVWKQAAS